ncbi:MAG TPA: LEA type 2 family protein [Burkholderiales bacterium]|nr:LEA type 2 family protein [Burkholderiales bacterium]
MDGRLANRLLMLLALLALPLLAGCHHQPKPPEYWLDVTLVDIRPAEMSVLEQTYDLTLRVQNPHNFDIDSNGMRFTLEANGKEFARGVSNQPAPIPRLGEAVVKVRAVSDVSRAAAQITDWRNVAANGFRYRIYGRIFAPDWSYPFDYQGQIDPGASQ